MLPVNMRFDPSIDISLLPEVYNPSDDSYLLLKCVDVVPGETLLEMGCGAGLVALHAAKAGAKVTAVDVSPHAVECTRRNAARNDLRVEVLRSDLFEKVAGSYDIIAFNPPYLPEDSRTSSWIERGWSGGREGSEVAVRFMEEAWRHLAPRGKVYLILSSLGGLISVLQASRNRYSSELLEERHMFFESIYGYRFSPVFLETGQAREKL